MQKKKKRLIAQAINAEQYKQTFPYWFIYHPAASVHEIRYPSASGALPASFRRSSDDGIL